MAFYVGIGPYERLLPKATQTGVKKKEKPPSLGPSLVDF